MWHRETSTCNLHGIQFNTFSGMALDYGGVSMTHQYKLGTRIRTTDTKDWCYDGVPTGSQGIIVGLTDDDGVPTYRVRFDDDEIENHLYKDEFEIVL
jgi:hypothetical protein